MQKTTPLGRWTEEVSRFTFFENTWQFTKRPESQVSGKWCALVLLAYASFAASITFLQQLLAYLNFRIRFILLLQTKKVISMNYGSSANSWKRWWRVRLDLIFPMRDIYINSNLNTEFTKSSRSSKFKYTLPWTISQMITKNVPISTRIVISYSIKWGIPLWIWWKVNGNWDTTWSEVPNGGKVIVEQILASEERKKSKRAGLW